MSVRTLDLFCGIGGLTVGLERAGLHSAGGVDIWQEALDTFAKNLQLPTLQADLTEVRSNAICEALGVRLSDIDILVGGPPCQGFSTVGRRDSRDPRNSLWSHYLTLVNEIRPAYLMIENVEGLVVMERGGICEQIVDAFASIGYVVQWKLLRSCDFGVPQLRKRVIFLGWIEGLAPVEFPRSSTSTPVTVKDAIFDLPQLEAGEIAVRYTKRPFTEFQKARRKNNTVLENHEAAFHSLFDRIAKHLTQPPYIEIP